MLGFSCISCISLDLGEDLPLKRGITSHVSHTQKLKLHKVHKFTGVTFGGRSRKTIGLGARNYQN